MAGLVGMLMKMKQEVKNLPFLILTGWEPFILGVNINVAIKARKSKKFFRWLSTDGRGWVILYKRQMMEVNVSRRAAARRLGTYLSHRTRLEEGKQG